MNIQALPWNHIGRKDDHTVAPVQAHVGNGIPSQFMATSEYVVPEYHAPRLRDRLIRIINSAIME